MNPIDSAWLVLKQGDDDKYHYTPNISGDPIQYSPTGYTAPAVDLPEQEEEYSEIVERDKEEREARGFIPKTREEKRQAWLEAQRASRGYEDSDMDTVVGNKGAEAARLKAIADKLARENEEESKRFSSFQQQMKDKIQEKWGQK